MKRGSNDQRSVGVRSDATVVGRGLVAFSGCFGQCASTHKLCAAECPKEIWAVRMVLRELIRLRPSLRPHGELLFLLMQKKPAFVPDSEAFNSFIGDGFPVPELKGECESSEDEQADNVSNQA